MPERNSNNSLDLNCKNLITEDKAVEIINAGGVVSLPTDTLYCLACNPRNCDAVNALLMLKGRDSTQGIALIADDAEALAPILKTQFKVAVENIKMISTKHWPGPITVVLDSLGMFSRGIAASDGSVGIRVPAHDLLRRIAKSCGGFITATSANPRGVEPASSALMCNNYFPDIPVLDGGISSQTTPSTIVDVRVNPMKVIRSGAVVI